MIRRYRIAVSFDESVEPVKLPIQTLDQMFRFAGAREVMILARKENDLRRDTEMFQRAIPLLALFDRHPEVVV